MKKVMIIALLISGITVFSAFKGSKNVETTKSETVLVSDFCDGWEVGYCEGWKDVKGQYAICPITPICPIPEIGENSYRGGYNRGFKAGMRAAHRD